MSLAQLADGVPRRRVIAPTVEVEGIFALASGRHRPDALGRAYEVLCTMLGSP